VSLTHFVKEDRTFDYEKLHEVVGVVARNLNKVIDVNYYPTPKTRRSNKLHRPIGIGVQGLADVFILMDVPFHSDTAKVINRNISETMYHAAIEASCAIARARYERTVSLLEQGFVLRPPPKGYSPLPCWKEINDRSPTYFGFWSQDPETEGPVRYPAYFKPLIEDMSPNRAELENLDGTLLGAYSSFPGSPASKGLLQFDLWGVKPSDRYDWVALKRDVCTYGLRNSLSIAPMPTASTSQILGNNECFEPLTSNIYTRRTIAGDFVVANKYLMRELIEIGMWNSRVKDNIVANKGSVQQLEGVPQALKDKYKIVWEIPMRHIIDMAADRGAFICQSQSLNLWMEDPTYSALTSMHFYSWGKGLKTGMYYLRRKPKHQPQQFTVEPEENPVDSDGSPTRDPGACDMCSG
jgi:ribonucleotide reductase alpha subunit